MKEDWTRLARERDAEDPLAALRERFYVPPGVDRHPTAYLCGHSLGLCPKDARELVAEEFEDWATLGVEAHTQARRPWVSCHEELTPLLRAACRRTRKEVVAMNSLRRICI